MTMLQNISGTLYKVKTIGKYPPVFEIYNFLSKEECQLIMEIAMKNGLEVSHVVGESLEFQTDDSYFSDLRKFNVWDFDKNNKIDIYEIRRILEDEIEFLGDFECIHKMMKNLLLDFDGNGYVLPWEFSQFNITAITSYINKIKTIMPKTKGRHSQQTWLEHPKKGDNQVLKNIQQRSAELTGLPLPLVQSSEALQVVRYQAGGHYSTHLDSDYLNENDTLLDTYSCCHYKSLQHECVVCRYATLLYFLNDVEEGGETAFPIANCNKTADMNAWRKENPRTFNFVKNCQESNLIVKPKAGKALLWYNHHINEKTGWLGKLDMNSYHSGCNVVKGVKWIANQWFSVGPDRSLDIRGWAEYHVFEEEEEYR